MRFAQQNPASDGREINERPREVPCRNTSIRMRESTARDYKTNCGLIIVLLVGQPVFLSFDARIALYTVDSNDEKHFWFKNKLFDQLSNYHKIFHYFDCNLK